MTHKLATFAIAALLMVATVFGDDIPVTFAWDAEVTTARPYVADVMRGETVALAAQMRRLGKPVALPDSATATFYWQTNGMANAWWTAPATVSTSGVVSAVWTPGMDAGAPVYGFFIAAADGASVTYRAFGTLRMVHAPGANPNAELPPPPATIDFENYTILNAPWVDTDDFIAGTNALWAAFAALDFTETDPVAVPMVAALSNRMDEVAASIPDTSNMMTTDTAQTVTGRKTFTGIVTFDNPGGQYISINAAPFIFSQSGREVFRISPSGVFLPAQSQGQSGKLILLPALSDVANNDMFATTNIVASMIPDTSNFMTLNTDQTVTGSKTFTDFVTISKWLSIGNGEAGGISLWDGSGVFARSVYDGESYSIARLATTPDESVILGTRDVPLALFGRNARPTYNGADVAMKNDIPPPIDTTDFATRDTLADTATASTNYTDTVTAPLASEEWVEQTYFDLQTYTNLVNRAGLELKFGERFRVYSSTTQGVTNSVSFSGSTLSVTFIADGFANSEAQLWSDALIFIDKLRGRVTQYNADAVETRAIADGAVTRRLTLPDESGTFATREYIDLRVPAPPASGTYVLKSVNGAVQWVAE